MDGARACAIRALQHDADARAVFHFDQVVVAEDGAQARGDPLQSRRCGVALARLMSQRTHATMILVLQPLQDHHRTADTPAQALPRMPL